MATTYNGWQNYETWNCALWLSSDYSFDTAIHDFINVLDDCDNQIDEIIDFIKSIVEDVTPDLGASMFADLLNNSLSQINYFEIAESYLGN